MRYQNNYGRRLTSALMLVSVLSVMGACKTPQTSTPEPPRSANKQLLPSAPAWQPAPRQEAFTARQLAKISDPRAPEISGLAASNRQKGLLWAINDSGNRPSLLAFSSKGVLEVEWQTSLNNRDWEDLASFTHAGQPYLLVAETGDNRKLYPDYELHIFEEPATTEAAAGKTQPLQPIATLRFVYPDGQHNSEAVAVSQNDNAVIIVTKASDSAGIYSIPLTLHSTPGVITATRLGTLATLPQAPGDGLIARLTGIDFAVATALDINPQSNAATLLTYREVYRWTRQSEAQSWGEVFAGKPQKLLRHELQQAEALSFDREGNNIYVTSERLPAPVLLLEPGTAQAAN